MANYETLKSAIQQVIKTNGNNEIKGATLQQSLLAMINSLGFGYQFVGVATLATNPGTPDQKVFYIANGTGTYTNFDGISITEDEVVILYYDTAWHKLLTGIASQDKLAELEQDVATKQDALTLSVKDNGNIVISNIQGQSKEFMPATPSGDPMHYAYEAAGALWNGTGQDITRVGRMTGDTIIHKAGYWYLNEVGDISNAEMRAILIQGRSVDCLNIDASSIAANQGLRTNLYPIVKPGKLNWSKIEVMVITGDPEVKDYIATESYVTIYSSNNVCRKILTIIDSKRFSFLLNNTPINLEFFKLKNMAKSQYIKSPYFREDCILYMITNEAATSAITITLHADAYARAMANADIVAALQAHPNVSLASA